MKGADKMKQAEYTEPTQVQWEDFANAIIIQAAQDYRKARYVLSRNAQNEAAKATLLEVERFFLSEWYQMLTNVDGLYILNRLCAEPPGYRVNNNAKPKKSKRGGTK